MLTSRHRFIVPMANSKKMHFSADENKKINRNPRQLTHFITNLFSDFFIKTGEFCIYNVYNVAWSTPCILIRIKFQFIMFVWNSAHIVVGSVNVRFVGLKYVY